MAKKKKKRIDVGSDDGGMVYSTGGADSWDDDRDDASYPERGQQTISVRRETKGRGGKPCVYCSGFQLAPDEMKQVAKQLKQSCGVGGSNTEDSVLIQGDILPKVMDALDKLGFKTKQTGG